MKKKSLFLIFSIVMTLSLSSCGSKATEATTESTKDTSESVMVDTVSEPTPSPTPTSTPTPTQTATPEPTSTPTPTPTATPEPTSTPDPTATPSNNDYPIDEASKAYLKGLGATDAEINNVKSDQDLMDLIDKLYGFSSSGTGNSGSTAEGGSSSASEDFTVDPSERGVTSELGTPSVGGSM